VHLEWSPIASPDLAVFDSHGRLTIVTFSHYLNEPFITRRWDPDPGDDAHFVVGCHWLAVAPANQQASFHKNIFTAARIF
jgi:mediator of RNA polymerase II transcription subunit 16